MELSFVGLLAGEKGNRITFVLQNGRILQVRADEILNGHPPGSQVRVLVGGIGSIISDYGNLQIRAERVEVEQ